MKSISFTISEDEIRKMVGRQISEPEIVGILTAIENDSVLWDDIQSSIRVAIAMAKANGVSSSLDESR